MTLTGDFVTGQTVSFQRMRALMAETALQEGVVGATDLQVIQRAAGANQSVDVGAGAAWIQIDTGTRNGLAHAYNDASTNVVVAASNGTNPRIDQIIVRYNDAAIPTGSGNIPTLETLTGTATSGATLDNRTGAASLPNDCLRLADILVPTSSTSVTTANIRDRRPWARGANASFAVTANKATASTTVVAIDSALQGRVECSGVLLRVTLAVPTIATSAQPARMRFDLQQDGVSQGLRDFPATNLTGYTLTPQWIYAPAAGSHVMVPLFASPDATTLTISASASQPLTFLVEELVRSTASNT